MATILIFQSSNSKAGTVSPAGGEADELINSYTLIDGDYSVASNNRLIVNDTLIVTGNFTVNAQAELILNDGSVCIIYGNLDLKNKVDLAIGAHLIVGGDLTSVNDKNTVSVEPSSAIYVMGTVYGSVDGLNCSDPSTYVPHTGDPCNYGDIISMEDNENSDDGIYDLFVSGDDKKGITPVYSNLCVDSPVIISALFEIADSYQWCDSIGNAISGETNYQFSPSEPGEYFVKIDDNGVILDSHRAKVVKLSNSGDPFLQPDIPTVTSSSNPICEGQNVILNISGSLNDATHWSVFSGSCGGTLVGTTTGNTYDLGALNTSETYFVRGEGSCVIPGACGTVTVTVNSLPTDPYSVWSVTPTICRGGDAILSASFESGLDLRWYSDDCTLGTLVGTGNDLNVTPEVTTVYYARTYNSVTQCESANCQSVTITVAEPPTITLGAMPEIEKQIASAYIPYSSTTGNPSEYTIDFDSDAEADGFADHSNYSLEAGSVRIDIPGGGWTVNPGTYYGNLTIKTYDPVGCESSSYPISVKITATAPEASVNITASKLVICEGEDVTFTATPTNGGTSPTYQWQVDGEVQLGQTSSVFVTSSLTHAQEVTCVMTSNLDGVTGNPATSNSLTITVNSLPIIQGNASSENICEGESVILTGSGASSYTWDNGVVNGIPFTPVSTGTYTVTGTDLNGCSNIDQLTITVNNKVELILSTGTAEACLGETNASLEYTSSAGSPNIYSIDFDLTAEDEGFTDVTDVSLPVGFVPLTIPETAIPGTYGATLTVENNVVSCGSVDYNISITILPLPATGIITIND